MGGLKYSASYLEHNSIINRVVAVLMRTMVKIAIPPLICIVFCLQDRKIKLVIHLRNVVPLIC